MNRSKPAQQHTDAVHSDAFTGNLERTSLLPGEIAARPTISQEIRAATGAEAPGRPWWYWPAIAITAAVSMWMVVAGHN